MVTKSQWELYTDAELQAGAKRWDLTIQQERQRIRILQTDSQEWPSDLLTYLTQKRYNENNYEYGVISWLKQGNSVSVDSSVKLNLVAVPRRRRKTRNYWPNTK